MSGIGLVASRAAAALDAEHFARWSACMADVPSQQCDIVSGHGVGLAACGRRDPQGGVSFAAFDGVCVTADARLDARDDLRRAMSRGGVGVPDGLSDGELIARAYIAWGERCVERLLGDFVFALWDEHTRRLIAARDHFGVRQLYYATTNQGLVASSSPTAVFRHPWVDRRLDDQAVVDFLTHDQVAHDATLFEQIRRLPAGHVLTWDGQSVRTRSYWALQPHEPVRFRDRRDYSRGLGEVLRTAVHDRVREGDCGVLLSGGIDSPAVAAVACVGNRSVHAYTAYSSGRMRDDEAWYAGLVAAQLGVPQELHDTDPYVPLRASRESQLALPLPDSSLIGATTIDLLRRVAGRSTVALTGIGPDGSLLPDPPQAELRHSLSGWMRLGVDAARHSVKYGRRAPLLLRTPRRAPADGRPPDWLATEMRDRFRTQAPWSLPEVAAVHRRRAHRVMAAGWSHMLESYAGAGRLAGVNVSHPFLDLRVVTYCLQLPSAPWCWDKHVLREVMAPFLPRPVVLRRKTPLRHSWLEVATQAAGADAFATLQPRADVRRYFSPATFSVLSERAMRDPYTHLRPIALDAFLRAWSAPYVW